MGVCSGFVLITAILVNGIQPQPVERDNSLLRPQDEMCQQFDEFYYGNLERCLKEGLVGYKDLNDCYNLNSQGPCDDGEILVFAQGPCLQTECAATPCRNGRNYEGTCAEAGSQGCNGRYYEGTCAEAGSQGCNGRFGRRVRPDLHGDAQCVCDHELGFVEFGGECYFEFLQGPCHSGEQLILDISGSLEPKCVKNTCSEGYMLTRPVEGWVNICYHEETFRGKFNESFLTSEECQKINLSCGFLPGPGTTIHVKCFEVVTQNGDCREEAVEPGVRSPKLLLLNLKRAFCSNFVLRNSESLDCIIT